MLKTNYRPKVLPNIFKIVLFIVMFSAANTAVAATDSAHIAPYVFKTIVIDAGHGGKDPGAHGAYSKEKNVALAIALKLRAAVKEAMPTLRVIMTRSTDEFIELQRRSDIANDANANLFISIHCNSTPQRRGTRRGAMMLIYGYHRSEEQLEALRENASIYQEKNYQERYRGYKGNDPAYFILLNLAMQKYREQSIRFGKLVNDEFTTRDGRPSEGVKEQGVLVLAHSAMPAVLVETGFINNASDEKYLNSDDGQAEIAQSILRALKKYKSDFER